MDEQLRAAERVGDDERAARLRARAGVEPLAARLTRVGEKLAGAAAAWRTRGGRPTGDPAALREDLRWFGAEGPHGHDYRVAPALDERELARLEATLGITLPADFRAFLAHIASAGAGPSYGLLPASRWGEHLLHAERSLGALSLPCLLDPQRAPAPLSRPTEASDEAEPPLPPGARDHFQGTLALVSEGCGYYSALVLNGPGRGRVVCVSLEGTHHFAPEPDFLAWYEAWLDRVLAGEQANA